MTNDPLVQGPNTGIRVNPYDKHYHVLIYFFCKSSSIFFPSPTLGSIGVVILHVFLISKFLLTKAMQPLHRKKYKQHFIPNFRGFIDALNSSGFR